MRCSCSLIRAEGIELDGIYFCPHMPENKCLCRKPQPGLVNLAAMELNFNPRKRFVIGDKPCDVELGQKIDATTFLVKTGYGNQVAADAMITPDYIIDSVYEAAEIIGRLVTRDSKGVSNAVRA